MQNFIKMQMDWRERRHSTVKPVKLQKSVKTVKGIKQYFGNRFNVLREKMRVWEKHQSSQKEIERRREADFTVQ